MKFFLLSIIALTIAVGSWASYESLMYVKTVLSWGIELRFDHVAMVVVPAASVALLVPLAVTLWRLLK